MKQVIKERIATLRQFMKAHKLAAFIIPTTDPHLSEYTASHWESRKWISGFTGSAGTIVITDKNAGLWTDSRYFLQAAEQIAGNDIQLFKEGLPGTPSITEWLCKTLKPNDCVGVDGQIFSVTEIERIKKELEICRISLNTEFDPMDELWKDRPDMPQAPAFIHLIQYAGKSCIEKVSEIRNAMAQNDADGLLVSALDEIAWTLNLRGSDVKCNPVVVSYLIITRQDIIYFIAPEKITQEVKEYLHSQGVTIKGYTELCDYLNSCQLKKLQLNPVSTNYAAYSSINPDCQILCEKSPIALLKAIKNEQEIQGIHAAMVRDGLALVRFLRWLEQAVPAGNETEISIDNKLHELRAEQEFYMGESFDTIAGYKEHAAIVHYSATPESDAALHPEGFLLLDSGAQYLDATTDITRTIALGSLTEEEKKDYTAVLKGHIQLAMCKFPHGTRGAQVDILARLALWKSGMNFLHGTGHGVGVFLSVHEGPQSIRMNENPVILLPGMLTSNEPGIYKGGRHGIRIENLVLVCEDQETEFGTFYKFETVTMCPIDTTGIIKTMMTQEEIDWLNEYHQTVYKNLEAYLIPEEKEWLKEKTSAI